MMHTALTSGRGDSTPKMGEDGELVMQPRYEPTTRILASEPHGFLLTFLMPRPVDERIKKLREEIAMIGKENLLRGHARRRNTPALGQQERRRQRLQEILDELRSLTDWKKPDVCNVQG